MAEAWSWTVYGASSSIWNRRDQCQDGEGRRRIGHEHSAPGFSFLATVLAVKVERVCPPRGKYPFIELNVLLVGPEPLQTLSHGWMTDRKAGFPEGVHDQAGRV